MSSQLNRTSISTEHVYKLTYLLAAILAVVGFAAQTLLSRAEYQSVSVGLKPAKAKERTWLDTDRCEDEAEPIRDVGRGPGSHFRHVGCLPPSNIVRRHCGF